MLDERARKCLSHPACSVAQAAEVLGLSRQGVLNAIERGDIRGTRIGRRVVVPTVQLRRILMLDEAPAPKAAAA